VGELSSGELAPARSALGGAANGLRGERRHTCGSQFTGRAKCILHLGVPFESVFSMQKHCGYPFLSLGHIIEVSLECTSFLSHPC
jgi:hypothetical protein